MSALSLLLGEAQFRTTIAQLKLDAAKQINHTSAATPSKNPIEARSGDPIDNFTDHIRLENKQLTIEGMISESPLSVLGSAFNVFTGAASGIFNDNRLTSQFSGFATQALAAGFGSIAGLIANRNQNDLQYPLKAFQFLVELQENRVPFTIVTSLKRYESMVLTNLSVPQEARNGKSLMFTASFEQINIVQTQTVLIPEQKVANPSGASNQKLGKQPNKNASDDNGSAAKRFFDSVGITTRGSGI